MKVNLKRTFRFTFSQTALCELRDKFLKMQFMVDRLDNTTEKEDTLLFSIITLGAFVADLGRETEKLRLIQEGGKAMEKVMASKEFKECVTTSPEDVQAVGIAVSVAQECAEKAMREDPERFLKATQRYNKKSQDEISRVALGRDFRESEHYNEFVKLLENEIKRQIKERTS